MGGDDIGGQRMGDGMGVLSVLLNGRPEHHDSRTYDKMELYRVYSVYSVYQLTNCIILLAKTL